MPITEGSKPLKSGHNGETAMPSTAAAQSSSVRAGRSPGRFARLRQTRVASLSPTPTLVGGSGSGSGSQSQSRSRSRNRSQSTQRTPLVAGTLGLHRQQQQGQEIASGRQQRRASASQARSQSRARTLVNEGDTAADGGKSDVTNWAGSPTSASDMEKGGATATASPSQETQTPAAAAQVPRKPLAVRLLPHPLPHFLGYRRPATELHPRQQNIKPYPSLLPVLHRLPLAVESLVWTFVGSFIGIAIVQLVFARPRHFTSSTDVPPHDWAAPIIVGSFGASSVLLYAAPASPLGQPRCFVGGQTLSAVAGVAMTKLIKLAGPFYYDMQHTDTSHSLVWVAGSLATGAALIVMTVTGTLHPPGGATAVLCATNMQIERMGWRIIPVVLLSSLLMLVWSLIFMNLGRKRFPETFWAPSPPGVAAGNLSQFFIDRAQQWWQQRRRPKSMQPQPQPQQRETPMPSLNPQQDAQSGASSKTAAAPSKATGKGASDPWQDESPWIQQQQQQQPADRKGNPAGITRASSNSVIDEVDERSAATSISGGQSPHVDDDDDEDAAEPVERPSRWASASARQ